MLFTVFLTLPSTGIARFQARPPLTPPHCSYLGVLKQGATHGGPEYDNTHD
jgi:hypothetical protein